MRFLLIIFIILPLESNWLEPELLQNINSSNDDYGIVFNRNLDKFYFTSERTGNALIYEFNGQNIKLLSGGINQTSNNQFYLSFLGERKAIFSSFRPSEKQSFQNLFESNYQKQSWKKGTLINELSGDYFVSHASISSDGSMMIFSSNKNNTLEDTDLFISYRNTDGSWDNPLNLEEINSPGAEITPCLVSNDSLFFASNGQGGEGGFDIFLSIKELGVWQRPIPLRNINSPYNDSDPLLLANGDFYFSSDRPGGLGGLDIYKSEKTKSVKETQAQKKDQYIFTLDSYINELTLQIQEKIEYRITNIKHVEITEITQFLNKEEILSIEINPSHNDELNNINSLPKIVLNDDIETGYAKIFYKALFIDTKIESSVEEVIPSKIEVEVSGGKKSDIKKYSYDISGTKSFQTKSHEAIFIDKSIEIPIKNYIEKVKDYDSFFLNLRLELDNNEIYLHKNFQLSKQITKESKKIDYENELFDYYLIDINHIEITLDMIRNLFPNHLTIDDKSITILTSTKDQAKSNKINEIVQELGNESQLIINEEIYKPMLLIKK